MPSTLTKSARVIIGPDTLAPAPHATLRGPCAHGARLAEASEELLGALPRPPDGTAHALHDVEHLVRALTLQGGVSPTQTSVGWAYEP